MSRFPVLSLPNRSSIRTRPIDRVRVSESSEAISIEVMIPGARKEFLDLEVRNNQLILRGDQEGNFSDAFWEAGPFQRCFDIPPVVDTENIRACFANGILEIKMPKMVHMSFKKIEVHAV